MNYEATIRQLKERRDFYASAVSALEKIHAHENGVTVNAAPKAKRKARRSNISDAEIQATMHLPASQAAKELATNYNTICVRRRRLAARPTNGSGEANVSVQ